jgi:uncharacterized protein YbjT (DUF2867 family)
MKNALVFGATGQTGEQLVNLLLTNDNYGIVKIFVRKPTSKKHQKLQEIVCDFNSISNVADEICNGDVFCCLGTTIAKAGSKDAFKKVDYDLPVTITQVAFANGINTIVVITSLGSNPQSNNFYLRTKGQAELAIAKVGIENTIFVRPSLLLGDRKEFRLGEYLSKAIFGLISPLLAGKLARYKGIHSKSVAKAMVLLANDGKHGLRYVENEELTKLGKE